MSLGACNCCEEPPCEAPTLECISVEGDTGTKCGFVNPDDGLTYATQTTVEVDGQVNTATFARDEETGSCDMTITCSGTVTTTHHSATVRCWQSFAAPIYKYSASEDYTVTRTYSGVQIYVAGVFVSGDCTSEDTYAGGSTWGFTCADNCEDAAPPWGVTTTLNADGSAVDTPYGDGPAISLADMGACDPPGPEDENPEPTVDPPPTEEPVVTYGGPVELAVVFPEFPDWLPAVTDPPTPPPALLPGQGRDCSALRDWSAATTDPDVPEGNSRTERKIKWRLTHMPTGTCYLKAWIATTFTPPAPPVTDPVTPPTPPTVTESTYEWTGSGNPCLTDSALAANAEGQRIFGDATEVGVPVANGVTTVAILKYSCVPGYEPDIADTENPQPSGFPDPTWEAEAP